MVVHGNVIVPGTAALLDHMESHPFTPSQETKLEVGHALSIKSVFDELFKLRSGGLCDKVRLHMPK
ncbi:hypothetical protein [Sporisorium scitamineum]|uniref:Uncharacterized protein n=1 Tax=Sporisorium scitamineum TaxID=49012 RepID=A0A0F7S0D0_9BASI|nr:hypothetical protein [Sporisorium scitamineum]